MPQIKIVLDEEELKFVEAHSKYGFKSKTALVNEAVSLFRKKLKNEEIARSAEIYAEIYAEDTELKELTDDAASLCLD